MELTAAGHVIELCSLSRPCDRDRVSERPFGVVIPPPSSDMSSPTKEEPTDGSTRMQQSGSHAAGPSRSRSNVFPVGDRIQVERRDEREKPKGGESRLWRRGSMRHAPLLPCGDDEEIDIHGRDNLKCVIRV